MYGICDHFIGESNQVSFVWIPGANDGLYAIKDVKNQGIAAIRAALRGNKPGRDVPVKRDRFGVLSIKNDAWGVKG